MIGGLCINMAKIFAYSQLAGGFPFQQNLLTGIYGLLLWLGCVNLKNDALLQLLLYGDDDFPNSLNRHILELTLLFIHETGRFEWRSIIYPTQS